MEDQPPMLRLVRDSGDAEFPGLSVQHRPKVKTDCQHAVFLVDDELRRVECQACGEILDAFNCLSRLAHSESAGKTIWQRITACQEVQKNKRLAKQREDMQPVYAILGDAAKEFITQGWQGYQIEGRLRRRFITTYVNPKSGLKVRVGDDGKYYGNEFPSPRQISPEQARLRATIGHFVIQTASDKPAEKK